MGKYGTYRIVTYTDLRASYALDCTVCYTVFPDLATAKKHEINCKREFYE